jgi:hypothetical protein
MPDTVIDRALTIQERAREAREEAGREREREEARRVEETRAELRPQLQKLLKSVLGIEVALEDMPADPQYTVDGLTFTTRERRYYSDSGYLNPELYLLQTCWRCGDPCQVQVHHLADLADRLEDDKPQHQFDCRDEEVIKAERLERRQREPTLAERLESLVRQIAADELLTGRES